MEINEKFITNSKYTTDEKCVYLNILINSDDYICNKSQLIISKELNISRTFVIKTLKSIELKHGLIIINKSTKTGGKAPNTYILT